MTDEEIQYDVRVINAFKSYGRHNVFNGLNMNVSSGSIYGLLGPSGCGKSTLLQCLIGIMKLDSGSINLKAVNLKDVGYMPQNLCLEGTLSIKETFEYYGTLYSMDKKNIDIKIDELNTFLQLPNLNSLIKDISGGQSRRVSLGVCLLHNPKLIILDEPTVGIDPLLRQEIWNGLTTMVEKHQKTIIITTHYIEEANLANCIGLMRNGVLVDEGSPQEIMFKYEADSLESAFLKLCSYQDSNEAPKILPKAVKNPHQSKNLIKNSKTIDFIRIKALLKKNVHVLCRDYWLLFTIMILPIIQTCIFCSSVGVIFKRMEIAIQNDEIGLNDCKKMSNFNECIFNNSTTQLMSCVAIQYLTSLDYVLVEVKDRHAGEIFVNDKHFLAFIHFPKNFTQDLTTFIDTPNEYHEQSLSYMHFAKHNILFKNQIILDVTNAMRSLIHDTLISCSNNPKTAGLPMEFNPLYGKEVKVHGHSTAAIFLAMGAFYFSSIYSVSIMLSERMDGILSRSMFAGVTILELLISMFCISNFLILAHSVTAVIIAYVIFSNPIQLTSGLFMYAALIIIMSWIGFLFGLLAAGITPTKAGGVHIMNGWALSQMLLSGGVWPIDGQSRLLRTVSELLPMRLAGKTMNDITLKGWTLDHPSVIKGTSATFVHAILLLLVLIGLSKVKKNMWVIHK
ncbi:ABC transporter G family member 23-like isoform X1 [Rhopalosiphum padi]|uniref:ABC transporter G family member 23-like isoform X1 n=2 Tax=Rhopalosiphum padi TaxID=40932 RepID=UPI00298E39A9|nr:ABC transporter G family member 23-like isoform X1 [Rhopalosiphum padi]